MLTEDYLMRMINQAIAALLKATGLKKSGKYEEALQALDQAFEQLSGLPANVLKQLDDASLLTALSPQGQVDVGRLAVLADLFKEEGEILDLLGRSAAATASAERALRLILEAVLAAGTDPSPENAGKIEALYSRLKGRALPVETRLALYDHYNRLLSGADRVLTAAGISRGRVEAALSQLKEQLGPDLNATDR